MCCSSKVGAVSACARTRRLRPDGGHALVDDGTSDRGPMVPHAGELQMLERRREEEGWRNGFCLAAEDHDAVSAALAVWRGGSWPDRASRGDRRSEARDRRGP